MTLTIENLPAELVKHTEPTLICPLNQEELSQLSATEREGIQAGLDDLEAGRVHPASVP